MELDQVINIFFSFLKKKIGILTNEHLQHFDNELQELLQKKYSGFIKYFKITKLFKVNQFIFGIEFGV